MHYSIAHLQKNVFNEQIAGKSFERQQVWRLARWRWADFIRLLVANRIPWKMVPRVTRY